MAFCKFCGREYPDGGSCGCSASAGAEKNRQRAVNYVVQSSSPNKKHLILAGAAVLAVVAVIILFLICCSAGGAKGTVKKYVKANSDKNGGKTHYSLILPDAVIKELRKAKKYDDIVDEYNASVEDMISDLEDKASLPKYDEISRKNKLSKSDLKHAAKYFRQMCEKYGADSDGIKVTKGYEIKVRTKYKDEKGNKKSNSDVICVVKVSGEGWKVVPLSADALEYYK